MMARRLEPEIPIGMEKVYRRFERWHSSNGGRRLITPESLWLAAVEAAREHGVFHTSKLLGLDYAKLKGMTQKLSTGGRSITKPPAFVELVTAESAGYPNVR